MNKEESDPIKSIFNDCFTQNFFVWDLTPKVSLIIERESDIVGGTRTFQLPNSRHISHSRVKKLNNPQSDTSNKGRKGSLSLNTAEYSSSFSSENALMIVNPKMTQGILGKKFKYTIKNRSGKAAERKYNQFLLLRTTLLHTFPGVVIPYLPKTGDKKMDSFQEGLLEKRRRYLQEFCLKIAEVPFLYHSDIFANFLDQNCNISKTFKRYINPKMSQIADRFRQSFQDYEGLDINEQLLDKIDSFSRHIKGKYADIRHFLESVKQISEIQRETSGFLINIHSKLADIEVHILNAGKKLKPETTITKPKLAPFCKFDDFEKQRENQFQVLIDFLTIELHDYETIMEAFKRRGEIEDSRKDIKAKIINFHKSFVVMNNSTEKMEKQLLTIQNLEKTHEDYEFVLQLIDLNMAYFEIDKFKAIKYRTYCEVIKCFSNIHFMYYSQLRKFFEYLLRDIGSPEKYFYDS